MNEIKKVWKFFSIMDYEKEADFLSKMHKNGWKLKEIKGLCSYHFEKCIPEDVVYQLDYNKEGLKDKDTYVQMFTDCDWEYLFDYYDYSYFRKPAQKMHGREEIFCDDDSRLAMVKRIFRGRLVPLLSIFFCLIIPQLIMQSNLHTQASKVIFILYCILFVLYLIIFMQFGIRYHAFKKKISGMK
ncbi:MAG: DUF2812 domain-containing protein [Lachnospiraceae bacterium]|nr:DUF2812 domain-containing protein [Lachnospiraceae bacterium]